MEWYYGGVQYFSHHKTAGIVFIFLIAVVGLIIAEVMIIKYNGKPVAVPEIPRQPQIVGSGPPLSFVILGDSTAVGQGGDYAKGIAVETANYLASRGYRVTYQNFGISGARAADVLRAQTGPAAALRPDGVLLAMGANDVTHLTRFADVRRDTRAILDTLQAANPSIKIVMTGSPEMGSVPRFPQPVKYAAERRTAAINKVFDQVAREKGATRAQIAEKTGPVFMKHPELFAQDKFHPSNEGYAVWFPVLNEALTEEVSR